ncbi:MAG TPA: hypothetical protein VL092_05225 [Chitinophagaceae bacterium]|nr:hypothetical protein [Chitinophagaceae bacterium]
MVLLLPVCFKADNANAQRKSFYLQVQLTPKLSVNNNTGAYGYGGSNEADGRSALAFGLLDYSLTLGYRTSRASNFSIGAGIYTLNQIFRPSYVTFGGKYRNIHQQLKYLTIPLSYERLLYAKKKVSLYAGLHLSFIGDVFRHRGIRWHGPLQFKNGTADPDLEWEYTVHYLNGHTFNFLYGFSMKAAYTLNKRAGLFASAQMMQGFRPLITSRLGIGNTNNIYSTVISTTNGQSLLLNLGAYYNL